MMMILSSCTPNDESIIIEESDEVNDTSLEIEVGDAEAETDSEEFDEADETSENTDNMESIEAQDDSSDIDEAKELNSLGYELYKKGDFEEALRLFEESIEVYNDYPYSHFNYACTLGVLMKNDYPSWFGHKDIAIEHLKKVLELDSIFLEKVKTDNDLDLIRNEFEYLDLLGYSINNTEDIEVYLNELDWYIQGIGIFQVIGGISFDSEGGFLLYYTDFRGFDEGDYDFPVIEYTGNYTIDGTTITFKLDEAMLMRRSTGDWDNFEVYDEAMEFTGELLDGGYLIIDIFDYGITSWYDEFSA